MNPFLTARKGAVQGIVLALSTSVLVFSLAGCSAKQSDPAAASQLQQELQELRATNQEMQRLRAENKDLPRLRRENEEIQRLREQTKDLAKLRQENDQLRGQLQALKAPKPKP